MLDKLEDNESKHFRETLLQHHEIHDFFQNSKKYKSVSVDVFTGLKDNLPSEKNIPQRRKSMLFERRRSRHSKSSSLGLSKISDYTL